MRAKRFIWIGGGIVVVGAAFVLAVVLGRMASPSASRTTAQGASAIPGSSTSTLSPTAAAPAATTSSVVAAPGRPSTTSSSGGPRVVSGSKTKRVSYPAVPPKPVKPKPAGPVLKDHVSSPAALTFLRVKNFGPPQTYSAVIAPTGWKDKASGMLVARVTSASLAGAINASTGQPMASPAAGAPNRSKELAGITMIAATNPAVRRDLTNEQSYKVYVVLLPSGTGAVFVVDRLR